MAIRPLVHDFLGIFVKKVNSRKKNKNKVIHTGENIIEGKNHVLPVSSMDYYSKYYIQRSFTNKYFLYTQ